MFRNALFALVSLVLAGCTVQSTARSVPSANGRGAEALPYASQPDLATGLAGYQDAVARVGPVAAEMCERSGAGGGRRNCNFVFRLVDDPRMGPNAFQTVRVDGSPIVVMTVQLVAMTQNTDEVAFVLSHEAAHHIADHLAKAQNQAIAGALVLGSLASLGNASDQTIKEMMDLGAQIGGRAYSQSFEMEADALGSVIAARAGFDPERGARIFSRPALSGGGGLLSTHPASAQRQAAVARIAAELRAGQGVASAR